MRLRCLPTLLALMGCCLLVGGMRAQNSETPGERKIVQKKAPEYPEIARRMHLTGTAKVVATVTPEGKVKKVEPVGGSPVLLQSAIEAVSAWRFAPANAETRETIELRFSPY